MEKIKQKLKDLLTRNPRFELIDLTEIDVTEDPVRPELTVEFRREYGRRILGLRDEQGDTAAIICLAFTNDVPATVEEMALMSQDAYNQSVLRGGLVGKIAVAYTVWARKKGGGKHILNEVYKKFKREHHIERLITLSPLTDMAERFHFKNGAHLLRKNKETQNFEYDITLEEWEHRMEKVKEKFKSMRWTIT
jgi:hypothetical protein